MCAGKYEEAAGHAIQCYQHYLQHTKLQDTDVLTRLGNLQVRLLDVDLLSSLVLTKVTPDNPRVIDCCQCTA